MAANEHGHHHHGEAHRDYRKCLTIDNIIIIVLGVLSLILNLVFIEISYQTFVGPVLYVSTGALGLYYIKSKEDTYAKIYKILIWVEIVFNIIAMIYLVVILIITGVLAEHMDCAPGDKVCEALDDALIVVHIILGITFIICLGILILMCFTLSHFKKFEADRQSHHYVKHHD
jgi:hypothetical protein